MGVYLTIDDLLAYPNGALDLVDLTDSAGTGSHDAAKVDAAIATVDSEIDGALRGRYTLPIAPVPEVVKGIGCDLVWDRLWAGRTAPEDVRSRASEARKRLDKIASGVIKLDAATATSAAVVNFPEATKTAADRVFIADTLRNF